MLIHICIFTYIHIYIYVYVCVCIYMYGIYIMLFDVVRSLGFRFRDAVGTKVQVLRCINYFHTVGTLQVLQQAFM